MKPNLQERRVSKRVTKAKRKLDFVYDKDQSNKLPVVNELGQNNNAQIENRRNKISKLREREKGRSGFSGKGCKKPAAKFVKSGTKSIFDGIQVSVNTDEEDLDYEDDILDQEEEDVGSMDEENVECQGQSMDEDSGRNQMKKCSRGIVSEQDNEMDLGASSASLTDEELVMNNPHLRKLLNKMLDERILQATKGGETSSSQLLTKMMPQSSNTTKKQKQGSNLTAVKSPSDTTIYAPALNRNIQVNNQGTTLVNGQFVGNGNGTSNISSINMGVTKKGQTNTNESSNRDPNLMAKMSNFVDQLRLEVDQHDEIVDLGERSQSQSPLQDKCLKSK